MGVSFVIIIDLLSSVPKIFRATKLNRVSCCSQQVPFHHDWVYLNEVTFGKHLRMGAGCRGTNQEESVETFNPTLGKELKVESITNGQWFDQSCL